LGVKGRDIFNSSTINLLTEIRKERNFTQFHVPFHNYLGPGTKVVTNIFKHRLPINKYDAAALIHDIEYLNGDYDKADQNFSQNINDPLGHFLTLILKGRKIIGYRPEKNVLLYNRLKNMLTIYMKNRWNMSFY